VIRRGIGVVSADHSEGSPRYAPLIVIRRLTRIEADQGLGDWGWRCLACAESAFQEVWHPATSHRAAVMRACGHLTDVADWGDHQLPRFVFVYPGNDGTPRFADPTYGAIPWEIQWAVDEMRPSTTAQRVALERTVHGEIDRWRDLRADLRARTPDHALLVVGRARRLHEYTELRTPPGAAVTEEERIHP
jgi:hypothetical protein